MVTECLAVLINEELLDPAKLLWQTPGSVVSTLKRVDRLYQVLSQEFEQFCTHPRTGSLKVAVVNGRSHLSHHKSTLKGREPKKLDLFGWKHYSASSLSISK